jgi:uncharacterized protein (TIGR00730 family)
MAIQSVCVYCGSSPGRSPVYLKAAKDLGTEFGKRGMTLVYGGSGVGLMGEVARSAIAYGGKVIGVIPQALLAQKVAIDGLSDLRVVKDMHERKSVMAELSEGFIALPGGYGTYEEFFEMLTWLQLGIHSKPCGLLNAGGYYDKLLEFLDHAVDEQFIHEPHRAMILASDQPGALLDQIIKYKHISFNKSEWALHMTEQSKLPGINLIDTKNKT